MILENNQNSKIRSDSKKEDHNYKNNIVFSSANYLNEHNKAYLKQYEKEVVEKYFKPGMKILDLGCGAGRTTKVLKDMNFDVVGIDISSSLIELAKQKYTDIDFRVGDALNLDLVDSYFDIVFFSFNGLDYIYPKSQRLKAEIEITRVLKSGGLFIYSSHNALNIPRTKVSIKTFLCSLVTFKIFSHYRIEKHGMGKLTTYYGRIWSEINDQMENNLLLIDLFGVGNMINSKNKFLLSLFSKHIMYIFKKK